MLELGGRISGLVFTWGVSFEFYVGLLVILGFVLVWFGVS